ncbi:MAG: endolytic transglycosylase MltG [Alphaproteobacteria bacterium]|uniref:endolytic transglycosylase MltG n=1 Tax=Brevundimonas sp. TaxID=1871086 RepID=UPI001813671B|nr:endolytic transglycosylase MltG [Brevundimonas sp.]MBA3050427.1 endolytic transglycosylase MltG [Brevundimonas sp.]MBU3974093.1 endolytic transglycosylase MltG [Alphaproteobacteria bacterium]MBU4038760.1 endolytic transglycosylase MltG [Alphaproteobacteria bacterium]
MSVERRSGRKTAFLAATATFSLFLIVALVAAWSVFYAPGPAAREGQSTIVSLPSGAGVSAIAATLKSAGVIRSTDMFKAAATLTGADRKLRAGEYEVPDKASLRSVLILLVEGRVVRHYVTLPEGWSSAQAVAILNDQPILTGVIETLPPEGSLWPDTYEVSRGETRASVIARMRRARDENLARLWAARSPNTVARTPEEAMILASIVEKETGVAAERPRVAAIFTNRIRAGMRLESDPTIEYGITKGVPLRRGLRRSELDRPNPWNTYQIDGLPPTAISNPGRDAVAAVLNPPATADLFFVADGSGGHAFARTYDEHLANVARWREIERRKAGLPPAAPEPAAPAASDAAPVPAGVTVPPGARVISIPPAAPAG